LVFADAALVVAVARPVDAARLFVVVDRGVLLAARAGLFLTEVLFTVRCRFTVMFVGA
jgi:hypothetical protein